MTIRRGHGPGGAATSCDDIGFITLRLATEDDTNPAAAIGDQRSPVDGTLPFGLPAEAVRPQGGADLVLTWIGGATQAQEALSATLEITAVDEAGNLSDPPKRLRVVACRSTRLGPESEARRGLTC